MHRFWKTIFLVSILYLSGSLLLFPIASVAAAREAITLCLDVVIPSLFPFLVCSHLFLSLGVAGLLSRVFSPLMRPIFGVPGCGALAAVLGVVSGYPVGASCVAGLYTSGNCTKAEAHRLLTFCNNSGPLFVLGALGIGMLKSQQLGILLYGSHLLSAFATGLFFHRWGKDSIQPESLALPPATGNRNLFASIGHAVADSVDTILKICGFVIIFAVFSASLPNTSATPFLYGLLEITGGIKSILEANVLSSPLLLPVISFFLALSGLSVLFQTAAIILPTGLSLKPYLLGKLVQAGFSFFFTMLFSQLFPIAQPATLQTSHWTLPSPEQLFSMATASVLLLVVAVLFLWLILLLHKKSKR